MCNEVTLSPLLPANLDLMYLGLCRQSAEIHTTCKSDVIKWCDPTLSTVPKLRYQALQKKGILCEASKKGEFHICGGDLLDGLAPMSRCGPSSEKNKNPPKHEWGFVQPFKFWSVFHVLLFSVKYGRFLVLWLLLLFKIFILSIL